MKKLSFQLLAFFFLSSPAFGQTAYIGDFNADKLTVVNLESNTVTASIPVGSGPIGVAASPDGTKVYVANHFSMEISVISTAENTVIATIAVGENLNNLDINADGSTLFANSSNTNTVSVINLETNSVTATIPVGDAPWGIAVSPDGAKVYTVNALGDKASVINTANNTVIATIPVGLVPLGIAISPDGTKAYVTNGGDNTVSVINTANNTVIATIPVGDTPQGIAFGRDGTQVYVTNGIDHSVSVINTANNTVIATVPVGDTPKGIAAGPDGKSVYVINEGNISIINTADNTLIGTIPIGHGTYSLGYSFISIYPQNYAGNSCFSANDINPLFNPASNDPQTSGIWDNTNNTSMGDPITGTECFYGGDGLDRTIWYSFTGDGNTYRITTVKCNSTDYINNGDAQLAIYSGKCGFLVPEACHEDEDDLNGLFNPIVEFPTQPGVEYFMLIDGYGGVDGQFCIEVTNLSPSFVTELEVLGMRVFPNPTSGLVAIQGIESQSLKVLDNLGRLVLQQESGQSEVDLFHLPKGIYTLLVELENGEWGSAKVVKQ